MQHNHRQTWNGDGDRVGDDSKSRYHSVTIPVARRTSQRLDPWAILTVSILEWFKSTVLLLITVRKFPHSRERKSGTYIIKVYVNDWTLDNPVSFFIFNF